MQQTVSAIWNQKRVPVVFRPGAQDQPGLLVRLPYHSGNRDWLRGGRRRKPEWDPTEKLWKVPRAWFSVIVNACLDRFDEVYVIQPHNPMEKCAPACWEAKGEECQCSCLGVHHGEGRPGGRWYEVSDALAVQWQGSELRWTLLKRSR